MGNKQEDSLQEAKKYSFLLLKFRLRSEKELSDRLKRKNFSQEIINQALEFLKIRKFISDEDFARLWVESRIKKNLGIKRLRQELCLKGIDKEIIEKQLNEIKNSYSEEEIIERIVREKSAKLTRLDPLKAKKRICDYLLRRGFSPETIYNGINKIKDAD